MEATKQAEFIFSDLPTTERGQSNQTILTMKQQIIDMQTTLATHTSTLKQQFEATAQTQQQTNNAIVQIEQSVEQHLNGLSHQLNHFNDAVLVSMIGIVILTICTTVLMTSYWQRMATKHLNHTVEKAIAAALIQGSASPTSRAPAHEVEHMIRSMQASERPEPTAVDG